MPKTPYVLKDFVRLFAVPINFHIGYPSQTNFPPVTGMRNITRPTNVRQPLKRLNRVTIPHTVASSRYNTYRIWCQKHSPEHLIANGRYSNGLPKGVHLDKIKKHIPKSIACLPQCIDVVNAVGQQFLPIFKNYVCYPLYQSGNWVRSSPFIKVWPIELGFGMRAHTNEIVGCVVEVGIVPLLECVIKSFGHAL